MLASDYFWPIQFPVFNLGYCWTIAQIRVQRFQKYENYIWSWGGPSSALVVSVFNPNPNGVFSCTLFMGDGPEWLHSQYLYPVREIWQW